jgi:hypothetical protein
MTKGQLFEKVSAYEIFKKYLEYDFVLKEMYSSPFPNRRDDKPSFNIFRHYKGELVFKDFAFTSGDSIKFVALMHNIRRSEAIDLIIKDFGLEEVKEREPFNPEIKQRTKTLISITTKPFNLTEALYWYDYGISAGTLEKYNVKSLEMFRINNSKWFTANDNNICFAYIFNSGTKIYKPYDKSGYKWITNCNGGFQGFEQLPLAGNDLIITKSYKDVMTLYELGLSAIAPHGETMLISEADIEALKKRFLHIWILYDVDKTGYTKSEEICKKYKLKRFFIHNRYCIYKNNKDEIKDISDFRKKEGERATRELLRNALSL